MFGLESALKKRADAFVAFVKIHCIGSAYSAHEVSDRFFTLLMKEEVKVVWHKAICYELDFLVK